jgi:hypothetical protein
MIAELKVVARGRSEPIHDCDEDDRGKPYPVIQGLLRSTRIYTSCHCHSHFPIGKQVLVSLHLDAVLPDAHMPPATVELLFQPHLIPNVCHANLGPDLEVGPSVVRVLPSGRC